MPFSLLTIREKHILLLISQGRTNRQIADALAFAPGTVRNHVSVILAKLGCENRASLAVYAFKNKLEESRFWEESATSDPSVQAENVLSLYSRIERLSNSHATAAAVIEALCIDS